jgi:hypothetical protein
VQPDTPRRPADTQTMSPPANGQDSSQVNALELIERTGILARLRARAFGITIRAVDDTVAGMLRLYHLRQSHA